MSERTPGPWEFDEKNGYIWGPDGSAVFQPVGIGRSDKEKDANCREVVSLVNNAMSKKTEKRVAQTMRDFAWALRELHRGKLARRADWGDGVVLNVQRPDEHSKMTRPYVYLTNKTRGIVVAWTPSQEDLFADDWELAS